MANTTGKKFGGRKKGTPNKSTQAVRDVIAAFADEVAPDFTQWILDVASEGDKGRAADLYLKAIEYHIPKLQRQEQQALDKNGDPADFSVKINVPDLPD
tara:strand:- start:427 stop:723 length:297 start_codon:yes stop_codon:yes gene_type:complete